jgi:NADH-quinone oxidoreductase subunit I
VLNSVKGMWITLASTVKGLRKPVTQQYPTVPTPVKPRFMGFPALTWDDQVPEPFCTGCMVCIRNCPTQCMSATMKDNPAQAAGTSSRRKIIDFFEINLNRCILCGICVEVCNFDAIVMSHEHEMSTYQRNGDARTRRDATILPAAGPNGVVLIYRSTGRKRQRGGFETRPGPWQRVRNSGFRASRCYPPGRSGPPC